MVNPAWSLNYPISVLEHKTAASSDHVPILLRIRDLHACMAGPRAFKYETMWEREESLFTTVAGRWSMQDGGDVQSLHGKLGDLVGDLAAWDRQSFRLVRQQISQLKVQLQLLRATPGRSDPTREETKITDMLVELFHREEMLWRQRARVEWLVHGDKNTYFFHLRASRRRRKNKIKSLQDEQGQVIEDPAGMEELTTAYYKELYTSEGVHDMERVLK